MPVLPVAGMPHPPKLRPHISSGEHREDHMAQSRKGNGRQHDLSGEHMQNRYPARTDPLMIGQKAGDKRRCRNQQNDIIRWIGDEFYFRLDHAPDPEKDATDDHQKSHDIGHRVRQAPPVQVPSLIHKDDMAEKKNWRKQQT